MKVTDIVVLDELDMILLRPDTFVGAIESKTIHSYIFDDVNKPPVYRDITYSPALLKITDEVLQNCYDHYKRSEAKTLTRIDVHISQLTGMISISDNAGIPVEIHPEYKLYAPDIIFGMLRSSTNYNDNDKREGGGRNGLGSKLTNIFSSMFKVETGDGKNRYEKTYSNNRRDEDDAVITKSKYKGTKISFVPDYSRLGCTLDADNYGMIITRVYEIAACAPDIDVYLNGSKIDVKGFEKFVSKFGDGYLYTENTHWRIGLHHSGQEGFKHVSFCNATHTWLGGTHVDYLADQLVDGVRAHVKKKTKQDLKPADIKNHFFLMVDCTVYNPRFSSQTKEHMNLAIKDYGTTFRFDEAFFKKLLKSDIVSEIVEWAINRKKLQDMADLKKMGKAAQKSSNKNIPKYEPASQRTNRDECTLFLAEGDSASNPLLSARDPKLHGVFALRGKPLNMGSAKMEDIKKNKEIEYLMSILGLEFFKPAKDMRYGKIVISTDADEDGTHIRGLIINNFYKYWPNVIEEGRLFFMRTPIVRLVRGKTEHEFFDLESYEEWLGKNPGRGDVKFLKGLGGHPTAKFKKFMFEDQYMIPLTFNDVDPEVDKQKLELAFGPAEAKKSWLGVE